MKKENEIIKNLRAGKNPPQFCRDREMVIVKYKRPEEKKYNYGIQAWTQKQIEELRHFANLGGGSMLYEFVTPLYEKKIFNN
jgi:hypothetical protein